MAERAINCWVKGGVFDDDDELELLDIFALDKVAVVEFEDDVGLFPLKDLSFNLHTSRHIFTQKSCEIFGS